MAEQYYHPRLLAQTHIASPPIATTTTTTTNSSASSLLLRRLQHRVSNSTQLFGTLTLLITVAVSLVLTGLTVVVSILGLILFSPLIIILSPLWVPAFVALFLITAGFLSTCGFGLVVIAAFTWMHRYFRGLRHHPPGLDQVGYLRDRLYEAPSKGLDAAAPGA